MLYKSGMKIALKKKDFDLFLVTPKELGYEEDEAVFYDEFCRRAWSRYGLELCPAEIAPRIAMGRYDSSDLTWIYIATEPISDPKVHDSAKYIFRIYPKKQKSADLDGWPKDSKIYRQDKFVFCREK